ncbi:MAG: DegT/DnrJ/EryC1/StrS family aminotransferase [Thermodesulfovibrionales bacterium]|nr:DegT/DnrJ/EryC1/StrS family aminotransferase [Thermodesulfovibrionales bacterium]
MKPMIDLNKQFLELKDEIFSELKEIFQSSQFILGKKVKAFEEMISAYHNVNSAVGVASGTDALFLSLLSIGLKKGDEVITTPFTFFATVEAIVYTGAKPVFVDIEPETFNIDVAQIESRITERTQAILPVHIFGHPADMVSILNIAKKYDLKVVEDCAQAFGAKIGNKKVGSFGDTGCFSFYPSKNLGAYGDGGMIITNDISIAERIRLLRNHGSKSSYIHKTIGYNSRLDEIQAGILSVKFKRIEEYNRKRQEKASLYTSLLNGYVKCPVVKDNMTHVYHQYTIVSEKRDLIQEHLKRIGIPSVIYYPLPLHLQEALSYLGYNKGDFPIAEKISSEVLSLPIYPELNEEDIVITAEAIKECLRK